jgi:hypothetical protein
LPAIATPEQRRALFFASAQAMAPTLAAKGYDVPAAEPSPGRLARIEYDADHARRLAVQMEALLRLAATVPDAGPVGVDQLLNRVWPGTRPLGQVPARQSHSRPLSRCRSWARHTARGVVQVAELEAIASQRIEGKISDGERNLVIATAKEDFAETISDHMCRGCQHRGWSDDSVLSRIWMMVTD